jgi:hypothetical protein
VLALGPGGEPTNLTQVVPLRGRLKGVCTSSQKHYISKGISPYRCDAALHTHVGRSFSSRTSDIPHLPFVNNPADATGFGAACEKNSAAPYHPSTPRDSPSRRCDSTIDVPMHCGGDAAIGGLFLVFVAESIMFARTGPPLLIRGSSPLVP